MICGKQIYPSRTEAGKVMSGVKDRHLSLAYFGADCNGWHVASQEVRSKKGFKGSTVQRETKSTPNSQEVARSLTFGTVTIHDHKTFKVK